MNQFRNGTEVPHPEHLFLERFEKKRSMQPLLSGSRTKAGEDLIPRFRGLRDHLDEGCNVFAARLNQRSRSVLNDS